jgi:hypothetical protein
MENGMSPPKKIRHPSPDDIMDLADIYDDLVELVFTKHADKQEHIIPSMTYIMAMSLPRKEDLRIAIHELETLFEFFYQIRKEKR